MLNKEYAKVVITRELQDSNHSEVKDHYLKLQNSLENNEFKDLKILIFQPIAFGDLICSSLSAELLQLKYPGCTIDYLTQIGDFKSVHEANPFVHEVFVSDNWELFKTRDTRYEKINGKPSEKGELLKKYDIGYGLYWWNGKEGIVKSFLEDLELPTDYLRIRLYTQKYKGSIKDIWGDYKGLKICLHQDLPVKWKGDYQKLKVALEVFGKVKEVGVSTGLQYYESAELLRESDILVASEGSLSHVAAAVGTQTVTLSSVYPPEMVMCAYYQNKYQPVNRQHFVIRPKDFCGDFHCIGHSVEEYEHKVPPYDFPFRFPPTMMKRCNYKNYKKSCIHEGISVQDIIEVFEKALENRKL